MLKMRGMKKTRSPAFQSSPNIDPPKLSQLVATGTCVHLEGELKVPPVEAKQRVELIGVQMILDLGTVDPAKYPLPQTRLTLESLRDYVHLRPRNYTISAIARIRNALAYATHTFFQKHGFLYVHTPIITTSDCEGAGEMFQVTTLISDAEKLEKELIKNPLPFEADLQVETFACALSSVYAFGPTFRAEHSHTSRHLAEFWMVEPEIAFGDIQDDMNCAVAYVRSLCQWLLDNCLDDMEFMVKNLDKSAIDRPRMVSLTNFVRISYTEAVAILEEALKERHEETLHCCYFGALSLRYHYWKAANQGQRWLRRKGKDLRRSPPSSTAMQGRYLQCRMLEEVSIKWNGMENPSVVAVDIARGLSVLVFILAQFELRHSVQLISLFENLLCSNQTFGVDRSICLTVGQSTVILVKSPQVMNGESIGERV
ncbi:hypothetical protein RHSIM_Rhsim05G0031100 [Rhododendron simsii]|uniref:Aminoacyl-transfer RNA synthetases class-II family profile domain-containing protein n=1 Tax=Rhododendron simsii TaxID=118357 RepID=A0A834GX97_RHOSS|nr:hypothetical protein RHSIM_Rhsim05G0031100 [Rhododendron simsii]